MRVGGWCGVLGLWLSSTVLAQTPPVPREEDLQASDPAYWWSGPGPARSLQLRPDVAVRRRVATTDLNGDGHDDVVLVARRDSTSGVLAEVSVGPTNPAGPCPRRGLVVGREDMNGWGVEGLQVLTHGGRAFILFAEANLYGGDYGGWFFSIWAYDPAPREFRELGRFVYDERLQRGHPPPRFRLQPAADEPRCLSGLQGAREVDRLCLDGDTGRYRRVPPRAAPITPPEQLLDPGGPLGLRSERP